MHADTQKHGEDVRENVFQARPTERRLIGAVAITCITIFICSVPGIATYGQESTIGAEMPMMWTNSLNSVSERRKVNHSPAIDVSDLFSPEQTKEFIYQFRDYLHSRYYSIRDRYRFSNGEIFEIDDVILKKFGGGFIEDDYLRIVFLYNDDWSSIFGFSAVLGNHRS